jgi:KaiC/GvpD/RAD55 family RecA-like ATPase
MHPKVVFLVLVLVLAIWQPHLSLGNAEDTTTEVSLYAHTDPSATSVNGRVLTLLGNTTSRQMADVRNGLDFTLVPPLSAPLRVIGRIDAIVWLQAQQSVRGTLQVTISELTAKGSAIEITSGSVTVPVSLLPYQVQFGLGRANYTLPAGSSIRFGIQFSPVGTVPIMLLWDSPSTPTRLVIREESVPNIVFSITDKSGKSSPIFPCNDTIPVQLFAEVTVEEPFRGINVRNVTLSVTNSSGSSLMSDVPMNLTSKVEYPLRLNYTLPVAIPKGQFNVTASVVDATGRRYLASRQVLITPFHTLIVVLVDSHKRPIPDLNVSLYADAQLITGATTSSSGIGVLRVPSTGIVGPFILEVRHNLALYLRLDQIQSESNSTIQVVLPLYDWNIAVSSETLSLPVWDAVVELYINGTLIASNVTDVNGIAHFVSLPPGTYNVTVTSAFASGRFQNVTHAPESMNTMIKVSFVPIPEGTLLIIAALALFAIFGVIIIRRRRTRTHHFKHVGELLGGSVPQSVVMMIVGPSGSGKSLLLQNMLTDSIEAGKSCIYMSNSELPSKIREQLTKLGVKVRACEDQHKLRFIDAYSGETGGTSDEKHVVSSPKDLTALGIQLTSCMEALGGVADVFFDSVTPIAVSDNSDRGFDFIRYYSARTTKSGGTFAYAAATTLEPALLGRFEEASDCVLQVEKVQAAGKVRGRLLVKKARGLEHERGWVGFKITPKGRMEFLSLPAEKL